MKLPSKTAPRRNSVARTAAVLAILITANCAAPSPLHAAIIDGHFSGTLTRILNGDTFYGPNSSNLVGTAVTGTFTYDTSSFVGPQCVAFSGPNIFCVNTTTITASISITINGQTVTVTQSSAPDAISNGNFAIGDDVIGVVPGFSAASSDYFSLNTFSSSFVGSIVYAPGPGVNFVNGIDPTQAFASQTFGSTPTFGADGFANSESHLGGGAIVDYTVTSIQTRIFAVSEPGALCLLGLALIALGLQPGNRKKGRIQQLSESSDTVFEGGA